MSNNVLLITLFILNLTSTFFLLKTIPEFMSIYFGVSDESTGFSLQQKLLLKTLLFNAAVTVFLIPPDSKNNSEIQF